MLDPLGVDILEAPATDEDTLAETAGRLRHPRPLREVTEPAIASAADGGCRIIARHGIGSDNGDVAAATRAGIVVTNVRTTASTRSPITPWCC